MYNMLKGIDPVVSPELLHILAAMGHGDEIAIVDANFPAAAMARRLVRMDGVNSRRAMASILKLLPVDDFVDCPVAVIEVVGDTEAVPETVQEFQSVLDAAEGRDVRIAPIDRFEFYRRSREAFAIVATGETRLYGCALVKKGVIRPGS
jgi:L-fucose mutarotase